MSPAAAVEGQETKRLKKEEIMNQRIREIAERYPDPGPDPLARLRHILDVFADERDDEMAILATSGIHESGRTGLSWGDLRKLLELVAQAPLTVTTRQLAGEYRTARDAFLELDMPDEDAEMTEECRRYNHTARVAAEHLLFEIDRGKEVTG